jgi:3-hydroxyisobutyrate dehydrogenase-like beta-hydroxyacid dehydrogenase
MTNDSSDTHGTADSEDVGESVVVLGLGAMGTALATTLHEAGHGVTVWNRSPAKADTLVARGVRAADTVTAAVATADLIVVCLVDNDATRSILHPVGEAVRGRTIVNLATGTPDEARELQRWTAEHNAEYLDGVMMAVPSMVGTEAAMILYGGTRAAYDRHQATLRALAGSSPFLGTDSGLPALYDVGLLSLLYASMTGWLDAFAVVGSAGVPASDFLPYAQRWFTDLVTADDTAGLAQTIDRGEYPDTVPSSVALNAAALQLLVRVHRESGLDAGLVTAISRLADQRVAEGHGSDSYTSLIEAIKKPVAAE